MDATSGGISRRTLIAGSAVLGGSALVGATQARAWSWSPTRSLAGSGTGIDPAYVWDPEADGVAQRIYERGQVAQVNEALAGWRLNGQETPAGLPTEVRDWVEHARQLPDWADGDLLDQAGMFQAQKGTYTTLVNTLGSGILSCAIPLEARAVYYSAGGANMPERISKTFKMGADMGEPHAYQALGSTMVSTTKTRLVHAAVRHLLPQSPHWSSDTPISNADILVTWHSLPTFTARLLRAWDVDIPDSQWAGYLHSWQVTGRLLGLQEEYIPATWDDAEAQYDQVMGPKTGPTDEGVELCDILIDEAAGVLAPAGLARGVTNAIARMLVGDQVAAWNQMAAEPVWEPAVKLAWPGVVALWDGASTTPLTSPLTYAIDEGLRQYIMAMENRFRRIDISLPTGNRPE